MIYGRVHTNDVYVEDSKDVSFYMRVIRVLLNNGHNKNDKCLIDIVNKVNSILSFWGEPLVVL